MLSPSARAARDAKIRGMVKDGCTQSDVARSLGLSHQTVGRAIHGRPSRGKGVGRGAKPNMLRRAIVVSMREAGASFTDIGKALDPPVSKTGAYYIYRAAMRSGSCGDESKGVSSK